MPTELGCSPPDGEPIVSKSMTAALQLSEALENSPAKTSKKMKGQLHRPRKKPIHGLTAPVSPA